MYTSVNMVWTSVHLKDHVLMVHVPTQYQTQKDP